MYPFAEWNLGVENHWRCRPRLRILIWWWILLIFLFISLIPCTRIRYLILLIFLLTPPYCFLSFLSVVELTCFIFHPHPASMLIFLVWTYSIIFLQLILNKKCNAHMITFTMLEYFYFEVKNVKIADYLVISFWNFLSFPQNCYHKPNKVLPLTTRSWKCFGHPIGPYPSSLPD